MSLSQFASFIEPGSIKFYLNSAGFITCDRKYHQTLYVAFLLANADRFIPIVGHHRFYNTIQQIEIDDDLRFETNGNLYLPPLVISELLAAEKRHEYIKVLSSTRGAWKPVSVYVLCMFLILLAARAIISFSDRVEDALNTQGEMLELLERNR